MEKKLVIESLPTGADNQPVIDSAPSGVNAEGNLQGKYRLERKEIIFKDAFVTKSIEMFVGSDKKLGSVFKIKATDRNPNAKLPLYLSIGGIVLLQGIEEELEYAHKPIDGWEMRDFTSKNNWNGTLTKRYPSHIKTQKQLIDYICTHNAFYEYFSKGWIDFNVEHPPEEAMLIDLAQAALAEEALNQKKEEAERTFNEIQVDLDAKKAELRDKYKDLYTKVGNDKDIQAEVESRVKAKLNGMPAKTASKSKK